MTCSGLFFIFLLSGPCIQNSTLGYLILQWLQLTSACFECASEIWELMSAGLHGAQLLWLLVNPANSLTNNT
jgi:hypothetical protein